MGNMQSMTQLDLQKKYMDFLSNQQAKFIEMFGDKKVGLDKRKNENNDNAKKKQPKRYCWTHGCCAHWSSNCENPKPGHKKEATFRNRLGGSNKNCLPLRARM